MIKVVVVDDEELVATSLSTLLSLEPDIQVVATYGSGEDLVEELNARAAALPMVDVVIADYKLPGMNGIEMADSLRDKHPDLEVVIVTSHPTPRLLRTALEVGTCGFIPKTATAFDFAAAVRAASKSQRFIDPELAAEAISAQRSPLTAGEERVLEAAGAGGSIMDIAQLTHLAEGTVRNYLSSAMSKLDAANRFAAYQEAKSRHWL